MQAPNKRTIAPATHRSTAAAAAFTALAAAAIATAAACGTTNVTNVTTTCGPGTRLVSGTCVVDAVTDASAGTDATVVEPVDDGGADADPNPNGLEPDDDRCPVPVPAQADGGAEIKVYNCDPKCGALHPGCDIARCRKVGEQRTNANEVYRTSFVASGRIDRFIVRLPRNPWTVFGECDPNSTPPVNQPPIGPGPQYTALSPHPRWAFAVVYKRLDNDARAITVEPGDYTLRTQLYGTYYGQTADPPWCYDGCQNFDPLPRLGDVAAGFEGTGCTNLNIGQAIDNVNRGFYGSNVTALMVLHTNALQQRAQNISFNVLSNCTGMP
jgi:hypothetical protein